MIATTKVPERYKVTAEKIYASIGMRIVSKLPGWDFSAAQAQIAELRQFLSRHLNDLGDRSFLLELTQDPDGDLRRLTAEAIIRANRDEPSIIKLSASLHVISTESCSMAADSEPDETVASELSEGKVVVLYEQRSLVRIYADGRTAGRFDPQALSGCPGKYLRYSRRPEQYEDAILDHYRKIVRDFISDHWEDRKKRILRAYRGKATRTEDIFQDSLVEWLDLHLDASVKGKVGQVTSDQTDIEINAPGQLYIIEIKWLGKNKSKTKYTIDRVALGMRQVGDYLTKQGSAKRATLLVYDGRSQVDFEGTQGMSYEHDPDCRLLSECEGQPLNARASCMLVFLRSTTASEI